MKGNTQSSEHVINTKVGWAGLTSMLQLLNMILGLGSPSPAFPNFEFQTQFRVLNCVINLKFESPHLLSVWLCARVCSSHTPPPTCIQTSLPTLACVNVQVFIKSGISPTATYLPACIHPKHTGAPRRDMDSASAEAEAVM